MNFPGTAFPNVKSAASTTAVFNICCASVRDSLMLLFTNPFLVDLARLIAEDKSAEIATWNPE
jgi:hypothetical protein